MSREKHAVTGAYGYSGKYIAKRLLGLGHDVITITNSLERANPFGGSVKAYPFNFDDPAKLTKTLEGVKVLYNTYWVRFNHKGFQHADAVKNTITMFQAAKAAGVERIVHTSITNPAESSDLEYFSGKARLEQALIDSGVSYAILRPAVIFGKEDILINNIAWALRRFPLFGVFGKGDYCLQPIYVDDFACLAVKQGSNRDNIIVNAIGPETFTYRELVKIIGKAVGKNRPVVSIPPFLGYMVAWIVGKFVGDVMLTRQEIEGLMSNLLCVDSSPAGNTKLTDWIFQNADHLGKKYTSELARRVNRMVEYQSN